MSIGLNLKLLYGSGLTVTSLYRISRKRGKEYEETISPGNNGPAYDGV
uniref:Uncharacterized protein n=1 Tax=viral metagenome TaxID=1070528 RepID=A0A6M3INR0_9ZZZZ